MNVLSNWGAGSSTLEAMAAILDDGGDLAVKLADFITRVEAATASSPDEGLSALGTCDQDVIDAITSITGTDDWTK